MASTIEHKNAGNLSCLLRGCEGHGKADCARDCDHVFLLEATLGKEMKFRVIWEIDIYADSPKQAVQQARAIQLHPEMPATVFDVWDHVKQKMHRVELASVTDSLDLPELTRVRAALRFLQCAPDLPSGMQDIVSIMLIFLDEDCEFFGGSRPG